MSLGAFALQPGLARCASGLFPLNLHNLLVLPLTARPALQSSISLSLGFSVCKLKVILATLDRSGSKNDVSNILRDEKKKDFLLRIKLENSQTVKVTASMVCTSKSCQSVCDLMIWKCTKLQAAGGQW